MRELPWMLRELRVAMLLDAPCGDFHWMRYVDLEGLDYHGADIVDALTATVTQGRIHTPGTQGYPVPQP